MHGRLTVGCTLFKDDARRTIVRVDMILELDIGALGVTPYQNLRSMRVHDCGLVSVLKCAILVVFDAAGHAEHVQ